MKTPLNYTGNKSKIIDQLLNYLPSKNNIFVDLFCGGATVGLSVQANKVIFIDNNANVINLLRHLSSAEFEKLLCRLEKLIEKYNLSYSAKYGYKTFKEKISKNDNNGLKEYNEKGYYELRADYNLIKDKSSQSALDRLYLLILYSFNNDIRFNSKGEFNLPAGKTDLNSINLKRLKKFINKVNDKKCKFICGDFRSEEVKNILFDSDFIYADPPYLLGHAVYNKASNWDKKNEKQLLRLLDELNKKEKKFALSNILKKADSSNKVLMSWVSDNPDLNVINIDSHYRGASYNKSNRNSKEKEVLITNYN